MAAQGDDHFLVPGQLVKVKMPGGNILGGEVVDPTSMGEAHKAALEAKQPAVRACELARFPPTLPVSADPTLRARHARLGRRSAAKAVAAAHQRLARGREASRGEP